jgi:DNA-binding transcriptional LysR family regulator
MAFVTGAEIMHRRCLSLRVGWQVLFHEVALHVAVDQRVGLEGSKFDVAIRGSNVGLNDSSYKARKLGHADFCLFATPEYVHSRPPLTSLEDLAVWDWIKFMQLPWAQLMTTVDGHVPNFEPRLAASCDSFMMAKNFVLDVQGFMVELYPAVVDDFKSGRLVHLLPDLKLRPLEVFAVYPANTPKDSLARIYIDFIMDKKWLLDFGWKRP